jgi:hypothetical protein
MNKKRAIGTVVAVIAAMSTMVAPTAAQAAPYCGIYWGSTGKEGSSVTSVGPLINVRAGQHDCFDRLVIDFDGGAGGYEIQYVPGVPHQAQDGNLPLRGGAFLNVVVWAPAYDINTGASTYRPADQAELVNVAGWQTLQQVSLGGSFEGQTTVGVGVRARLPFRAFILPGPGERSRLVIDIAHHW